MPHILAPSLCVIFWLGRKDAVIYSYIFVYEGRRHLQTSMVSLLSKYVRLGRNQIIRSLRCLVDVKFPPMSSGV